MFVYSAIFFSEINLVSIPIQNVHSSFISPKHTESVSIKADDGGSIKADDGGPKAGEVAGSLSVIQFTLLTHFADTGMWSFVRPRKLHY